MQPEDIIELLESDNVISRREGLEAYFEFLVPPPPEDGDSKGDNQSANDNQSAYKHTKLWRTILGQVRNGDEADEIICNFFKYIMKRFRTGEGILSDEEIAKEKEAPKIQNLEAFAFMKCKYLIIDYKRKMGKQREREVITDKSEELGLGQTVAPGQYFREKDLGDTKSITGKLFPASSRLDNSWEEYFPNAKKVLNQDENLLSKAAKKAAREKQLKGAKVITTKDGKKVTKYPFDESVVEKSQTYVEVGGDWKHEGDKTQKLIEECVRSKLIKFAKEVSPDGAEAIGMQINGIPIKKIAKWQGRTVGAQKQFLRASKERAADYLAPCNEINAHSKAPEKLRKK
jgi:hypothetical protein